jgi:hypothetical protein
MKKFFFLFFLANSFSAFSQLESLLAWDKKSISGWETLSLKGKPKSLEQTAYKAVEGNGKTEKGERSRPVYVSLNGDFLLNFDSLGRTTNEKYSEGGELRNIEHVYDALKNTESITTTFNKGKELTKTVYTYNASGKIAKIFWQQFYGDEDFHTTCTRKFDSKGNPVESNSISTRPGETINTKTRSYYNAKNQLICLDGYGENGAFWNRQRKAYDLKGRLIKEEFYMTDTTKIEHSMEFAYDEKDNVVKKDYKAFQEFVYDNKGNVVRKNDKKSEAVLKKTFEYIYVYDKQGNWISRTDYENGKATAIIERRITYY